MSVRRFFNIQRPKQAAVARPAGDSTAAAGLPMGPPARAAAPMPATPAGTTPGAGTTGVFITPQTITTFPVATLVVTLIWKTAGALDGGAKTNNWIPLIASAVIGALIYWISYSDPQASFSRKDRWTGVIVALLNSLYLFASATGLLKTIV